MNEVKKVQILIHSLIDDAESFHNYDGEYLFKENTHNIAYTDYSGNAITKNAVQATQSVMLLHRVGGFSGDMFFDISSDTIVKYDAFMIECGFVLHTYEYSLTENNNTLTIFLKYGLHDGQSDEEINCQQTIKIILPEEENNE